MRKTKDRRIPNKLAQVFRALGQPARLDILLAIGAGEACVCHLEAATGQRQAYISQHLMALRKAKLVATRREGRNIFYRLKNPAVLDLLHQAASLGELAVKQLPYAGSNTVIANCRCPHCSME